ncbi:hypothetical protein AB4Z51_41430, partial [Bradyrhizobium sp. 2TAF36]|uniref:hypothetical protein n=1 Tax=Bradyrhizobium sp. 2TAF36 TaxID=3233016 RepID=UPI003F8DFE12
IYIKIYINPFGFSDLSPGEVIAIALRRFDRSPSAGSALKELLSELPEMTLSLIGFNGSTVGSTVCKLYFVVGVKVVEDLTAFLCASGVENSGHIARLFFRNSERRIEENVLQVHMAVTVSDPPAAKTSIYLQPSRCAPSGSLARISEAGRMFGLGESVLEHALKIAQTDEGSGEGRLNFIGFGAKKADLYFRAF